MCTVPIHVDCVVFDGMALLPSYTGNGKNVIRILFIKIIKSLGDVAVIDNC